MAKGRFKCSKCDRTFSMAAHLARHKNTIHKAGAGKKTAARKVVKRKGRVGRPKGVVAKRGRPKLSVARRGVSVGSGAARLLNAMQAYRKELMTERLTLDSRIDAMGRALDEMGAKVSAGPARRVSRKGPKVKVKARKAAKRVGRGGVKVRAGSLKDYIGRVLRQRTRPMSPSDIGAGVVKAGLKTKAKDITKAVSNTLPKMKNIKKMGFGKYQLSG